MQAASGNKTTGFAVEARGCRRKGGQEKAGAGGTKKRSEAHLEQWSVCIYIDVCCLYKGDESANKGRCKIEKSSAPRYSYSAERNRVVCCAFVVTLK